MRSVRASCAAFVLTVLTCEAVVRSIAPWLPVPSSWAEPELRAKYQQMQEMGRGGGVDVVFWGTSQMLWGLDPRTLVASADWTSYNAAIPGGSPVAGDAWLRHAVVPLLHPRTVVIGVSAIDFDKEVAPADPDDRYRGTPWRRGILDRAGRWTSAHVALVRHRQTLRQPEVVLRGVARRRAAAPPVADPVPDCTRAAVRDPAAEEQVGATLARRTGLNRDEAAALRRQMTWLRDRGVDVVLVLMPSSGSYRRVLADHGLDLEEIERRIASFAGELSVPFLDVTAGLHDDRFFQDYAHLGCTGSVLFTTALLDRLAPLRPGG